MRQGPLLPPSSSSTNVEVFLYQDQGILHLSATRWALLIMGCVVPEVGGAILVFPLFPYLGVILLGSALATLAFLFLVLKKQKCRLTLYRDSLEITTSRSHYPIGRKYIKEVRILDTPVPGVQLVTPDEILFIEIPAPEQFAAAFRAVSLSASHLS